MSINQNETLPSPLFTDLEFAMNAQSAICGHYYAAMKDIAEQVNDRYVADSVSAASSLQKSCTFQTVDEDFRTIFGEEHDERIIEMASQAYRQEITNQLFDFSDQIANSSTSSYKYKPEQRQNNKPSPLLQRVLGSNLLKLFIKQDRS